MLVAFVCTLAFSFVIVRVGAIAFQLTGLEWSLAKFQSLSCFTGTGFTTKEAELITGHPQRRKIASILMVLGNAGLVILIATGASTIITQDNIITALSEKLGLKIPTAAVKWINTALLIITLFVFYKVVTNQHVTARLTSYLRDKIVTKDIFGRVSFEELMVSTGGYGISRVTIKSESPVLGKNLADSGLRGLGINLLAIVRGAETISNPTAQTTIQMNDELVCFGKLGEIRHHLCPDAKEAKIEQPDEKNTTA